MEDKHREQLEKLRQQVGSLSSKSFAQLETEAQIASLQAQNRNLRGWVEMMQAYAVEEERTALEFYCKLALGGCPIPTKLNLAMRAAAAIGKEG